MIAFAVVAFALLTGMAVGIAAFSVIGLGL